LKPIITIYSAGTTEEPKKLEGYISAAFWIGVDHAEGEIGSVKVRQPVESYDNEVAALTEFTDLMVQRQINFSVEFFMEPALQGAESQGPVEVKFSTDTIPSEVVGVGEVDYETEIARIRDEYKKGIISKRQYETKKGALLKKWKENVEGTLKG
jgi:hypothetical protein